MRPLTKLQYDSKGKPITYMSLQDYFACPDIKEYRCQLPQDDIYKSVYITDDDAIFNWATKENSVWFWLLKLMYRSTFFTYLIDNALTINSTWQDVLHVDDIVCGNDRVYVEDTLILNCKTVETYEKVIPFLCGPYKKLIIHGNITCNQVMKLMHANVKKTRIDAAIQMDPSLEYDIFVKFVAQHAHGFDYKFYMYGPWMYETQFIRKFSNAFRQTEYGLLHGGGRKPGISVDDDNSTTSVGLEAVKFSRYLFLGHLRDISLFAAIVKIQLVAVLGFTVLLYILLSGMVILPNESMLSAGFIAFMIVFYMVVFYLALSIPMDTYCYRERKENTAALDDEALKHGVSIVQWACEHNFEVPGDYVKAFNKYLCRFNNPIRVRINIVDFLDKNPISGLKLPARMETSYNNRLRRLAQSQRGTVYQFLKFCLKVVKDIDNDQYETFMKSIATSAPTLHGSLYFSTLQYEKI